MQITVHGCEMSLCLIVHGTHTEHTHTPLPSMYVCGCVSMSVVVRLYAEEEKLHQRRVI